MKENIKNIKISKRSHKQLKMFCDEHGLKMFKYVERLIEDNCKIQGKNFDEDDIYGDKNN